MNQLPVYVSCSTVLHTDWQSWLACSYTDELAVFRFRILEEDVVPGHLYCLLTPDERSRAGRYRQRADQLRFIYGRLGLRFLAAMYLQRIPAEIVVIEGANKKPEIKESEGLRVNLSHAGEWAVWAIGKNNVGIDVELKNESFLFEDLLDQSFSPMEQEYIQQSQEQRETFYTLWTRKEALVKTTAKGIDDDFPLVPSIGGTSQVDSLLIGGTGAFQVESFSVSDGYVAALAWQLPSDRPKFYTLESGFFEITQSKNENSIR